MDECINDKMYKITFMGMSGSGKTSIINRLINRSFTKNYLQNLEIKNYIFEHLVSEDNNLIDSSNSGSVKLILEDVFGLNNQIIQTSANQIQSQSIVDIREKMIKQFQDVMFSIARQNDMTTKENSKEFLERIAFVFVIDITADPTQFKQLISIIKTIHEAEKNYERKTLKCFVLNKIDLAYDFTEDNFIDVITKVKTNFSCDVFSMSALTLENFGESMTLFLNKCYRYAKRNNKSDIIEENQINKNVELVKDVITCDRVGNIFTCGVNYSINYI